MHSKKWLLIFIILLGGAAVLGSYVYGFLTHPDFADVLWGGVPENIRPFYTINMFLAAAGYFAFTYFILFRLNPPETRIFGRFGYGLFTVLYTAILVPSALWMPLTLLAIEHADLGLIWMVRLVLAVVGLASLGLLYALIKIEPHQATWAHKLAIVGSIFFSIQTVILDALVWGSLFRS
jgi:hypothetical protein